LLAAATVIALALRGRSVALLHLGLRHAGLPARLSLLPALLGLGLSPSLLLLAHGSPFLHALLRALRLGLLLTRGRPLLNPLLSLRALLAHRCALLGPLLHLCLRLPLLAHCCPLLGSLLPLHLRASLPLLANDLSFLCALRLCRLTRLARLPQR
jgi:hypothetical protein